MAAAKKAKPAAKKPAAPQQKAPADPKPKAKAATAEAKQKDAPKAKAPKSKSPSSPDIYTDPALRDKLKAEITAGDKGGKPGQWSARKAQLLASEYEKAGGDYKNGKKKKTAAQQHLDSWTDEEWKTADGKAADRDGGTTRYLPAEAWNELSPAEKKATNAKKQAGSQEGKQFVANTAEAKKARKSATKAEPDSKAQTTQKTSDSKAAKPRSKAKPKSPLTKKSGD